MKVVKEKIWWEFTCRACGSECEAEPNDVTGHANLDCDLDVFSYTPVVECGKCGKEHRVPTKKITEKIQNIATENGSRRR